MAWSDAEPHACNDTTKSTFWFPEAAGKPSMDEQHTRTFFSPLASARSDIKSRARCLMSTPMNCRLDTRAVVVVVVVVVVCVCVSVCRWMGWQKGSGGGNKCL